MKTSLKAKWIIGISGTAFSAFALGQIIDAESNSPTDIPKIEINSSMSEREVELSKLDWSNFTVQVNNPERSKKSDRTSRRT